MNANNSQQNIIMIIFTFEQYGKQIFIDMDENELFKNTINELEEKYNWLKSLNGKKFIFNGREITNQDISLKDLGIKDNSSIIIQVQ